MCTAITLAAQVFTLILALSNAAYANDEPVEKSVKVAIQVGDGKHRVFIKQVLGEFERRYPNIAYELIVLRDVQRYPLMVEEWLAKGEGPDIIYWYAGQRIKHFQDMGQLQDISAFWSKNKLDQAFPKAVVDSIKIDNKAWAIPVTYFLWALYYREHSFKRLGLAVPTTWAETLHACKKFRENGIDLFAFGSKTAWASHAWFDYINLRLNGLSFYRDLLAGRIAYTDDRVKLALRYWRQLLDNECFNANYSSYTVWQAFPRVLHGLSAMTLADGVPQIDMPREIRDDIRMAYFPEITEAMPRYTVAPVNVFMVPAYTRMRPELEKMLMFLASPEFQASFNAPISRPAALITADRGSDVLAQETFQAIASSPGGIQYLDRDTDIRFANKTPAILVDFMQHRDVDKTAKDLESLRKEIFGPLLKK